VHFVQSGQSSRRWHVHTVIAYLVARHNRPLLKLLSLQATTQQYFDPQLQLLCTSPYHNPLHLHQSLSLAHSIACLVSAQHCCCVLKLQQ
jgi:hypothetical protein